MCLFCFVLLSCLVNVFLIVSCLKFIDMFPIRKQLMQRLDQWNECKDMVTLGYVLTKEC